MNAERQANGSILLPPARTARLNGVRQWAASMPLPPFRHRPMRPQPAAPPDDTSAPPLAGRDEPDGQSGNAVAARIEPVAAEAAFDAGVAPTALRERIQIALRSIPDFPEPGIVFRDITPVLADARLLRAIVLELAERFADDGIDLVAAVESRGFILGAPLAVQLGAGFVPIRKPGKLPHRTVRVDYDLEYGSDAVEAHIDALLPGHRVLLIDDVLATGGTARAALRLIEQLNGHVVGAAFLIELAQLGGRDRLSDVPVTSLLRLAD